MKVINENNKTGRFVGLDLGELGRVGLVVQPPKQEPKFRWVDIESTMISRIGHSKDENILRVKFNNGKVYEYTDVTHSVFKNFAQAESVGRFFHSNIKNVYPTTEIVA